MSNFRIKYDELTEEYYVIGKDEFLAYFYGRYAYSNAKKCLKAMSEKYE
jgi:hypothetical protein